MAPGPGQSAPAHLPSQQEAQKTVEVGDLVGTVEIAECLGVVDHNVLNTWHRRHGDFPEPVVTLTSAGSGFGQTSNAGRERQDG